MTQDEIIRMAREAGVDNSWDLNWFDPYFERFAALVAAHEREKYKAMDKELAELYEMAVNQAKTIKKYQDAVLAEREACAKLCEQLGALNTATPQNIAAAIRGRIVK